MKKVGFGNIFMKILLFIEHIVCNYLQTGSRSEEGSTPRAVPSPLCNVHGVARSAYVRAVHLQYKHMHQRETSVPAFYSEQIRPLGTSKAGN